jgi:hypothetical protein
MTKSARVALCTRRDCTAGTHRPSRTVHPAEVMGNLAGKLRGDRQHARRDAERAATYTPTDLDDETTLDFKDDEGGGDGGGGGGSPSNDPVAAAALHQMMAAVASAEAVEANEVEVEGLTTAERVALFDGAEDDVETTGDGNCSSDDGYNGDAEPSPAPPARPANDAGAAGALGRMMSALSVAEAAEATDEAREAVDALHRQVSHTASEAVDAGLAERAPMYPVSRSVPGRGLHSSASQFNLSRFCHSKHPNHPTYP